MHSDPGVPAEIGGVPPGWGWQSAGFFMGGYACSLGLCPTLAVEVNGVVKPKDTLAIDQHLDGARSRRDVHGLHGDS